jgi:hypothetical protein
MSQERETRDIVVMISEKHDMFEKDKQKCGLGTAE